jgi:hypothetical protein
LVLKFGTSLLTWYFRGCKVRRIVLSVIYPAEMAAFSLSRVGSSANEVMEFRVRNPLGYRMQARDCLGSFQEVHEIDEWATMGKKCPLFRYAYVLRTN